MALDCKINFDDNAMFRHKDLKELRDLAEEDPLEVEASKFALNYIKLDGNIACMVNGAGLAMATMDIIQYAGGSRGELPRRRRRREPGADRECVRDSAERSECEGDLHQYLRRHSARGCAGDCGGCGGEEAECAASDHPAAGRNERGRGPQDSRRSRGLKFEVGATMKEAADLAVAAAKGGK